MPRLNKPTIAIHGPRKVHRDATLVVIATEGEKTEAQYFGFEYFKSSRVKLVIIPSEGGRSAPLHVLENLKRRVSAIALTSKDQLWVVCDVDRWPYDSQLRYLQNKKVGSTPVQLAISNPCFELFLYLHFRSMPVAPVPSSSEMMVMLRKVIGRYSKGYIKEELYIPSVSKAIHEADNARYGSNRLPLNPGTDVGRLVKTILEMRPMRERVIS